MQAHARQHRTHMHRSQAQAPNPFVAPLRTLEQMPLQLQRRPVDEHRHMPPLIHAPLRRPRNHPRRQLPTRLLQPLPVPRLHPRQKLPQTARSRQRTQQRSQSPVRPQIVHVAQRTAPVPQTRHRRQTQPPHPARTRQTRICLPVFERASRPMWYIFMAHLIGEFFDCLRFYRKPLTGAPFLPPLSHHFSRANRGSRDRVDNHVAKSIDFTLGKLAGI